MTTIAAIDNRSRIPGAVRNRSVGRQPLKRRSPWVFRIGAGVMAAGILATVVANLSSIGNYINRPITSIEISGAGQFATESTVSRLLNPFMGSGFFDFDVSRAKATLEQEPWIYTAALKRSWPNTLSVEITEQVAIARWGNQGLINQYGNIFNPQNSTVLSTLPVLSGSEGKHGQVMEQYQRLSQILFSSGLRLTGLTLSPRGSWELTLNDSASVMLGRVNIDGRLQRFVDFYNAHLVDSGEILESVDLRYENGIAVSTKMELQKEVAGIDHGPASEAPEPFALSGELEL